MRVWGTLALAVAAVFLGAPQAAAQETPRDQCVLADKRLAEVSGLATDGERWYVVNDGGSKSTVYVLSHDCAVQKVISGPTDPFDVEDLARTPDGTLWLADVGDNQKKRKTVALIALTPAGKTTLYRLTYPDGPHDTEALLMDRNGVPHLVTKSPFGVADVYRPAAPLASPGPTPLEHVGQVVLSPTSTKGGPVGTVGTVAVTGGSVSLDGTVVVLRTYTEAYLYAAPDGDVVEALKRTPVRVPLPDEQQGEAIAVEPDGTLVSMSEGVGTPVRIATPSAVPGVEAPPEERTTSAPPPAEGSEAPGETTSATPPAEEADGLAVVPALGVTAVVVGGALLIMHRRAVRRR